MAEWEDVAVKPSRDTEAAALSAARENAAAEKGLRGAAAAASAALREAEQDDLEEKEERGEGERKSWLP